MSNSHNIRIKRTVYDRPDYDPFDSVGVREMGRITGLDPSYLARVRNGKMPITKERYLEICDKVTNHIMEINHGDLTEVEGEKE